MILYNVPGRTGTNMTAATALRLASHPNIIAVKEASGNLGQAQRIIAGAEGEDFVVLSGDDALTLGMVSAGGNGVISVIANALPAEFSEMVHAALDGDMELARRHNKRLSVFYPLLSVDGNPAVSSACCRFSATVQMNCVYRSFPALRLPPPASHLKPPR